MRRLVSLLAAGVLLAGTSALAQTPLKPGTRSILTWSGDQQASGYRTIEKIYRVHTLRRGTKVHPLPKAAHQIEPTFEYEGNTYRVQRTMPRGKSTMLEFQVLSGDGWRALTEHTTRETQARIEQTLRLDYETFVNASFFLQGKADQFTQQKSSDRKRILGSIMGLEIWETYRQRVIERRKRAESEITGLDGRAAEINAELGEEETRLERLATLQAELKRLSKMRKAEEAVLEQAHKVAATLAEQRKLVSMLGRNLLTSHPRAGARRAAVGRR